MCYWAIARDTEVDPIILIISVTRGWTSKCAGMYICISNINTIMFYMHVTHIRYNYWYCLLHCSQLMIVILGQRLSTPSSDCGQIKLAVDVCWNRNCEMQYQIAIKCQLCFTKCTYAHALQNTVVHIQRFN